MALPCRTSSLLVFWGLTCPLNFLIEIIITFFLSRLFLAASLFCASRRSVLGSGVRGPSWSELEGPAPAPPCLPPALPSLCRLWSSQSARRRRPPEMIERSGCYTHLDRCLGALACGERPASGLRRRRLRGLGRAGDLCCRRWRRHGALSRMLEC